MIRIASRFCGPPDSGNGGYSSGLLASQLPGRGEAVEVTLRRPPPLERELSVRSSSVTAEGIELVDGEQLVAEARPSELALDLPAAPSFERASELSRHYVGHQRHHFPGCFVCGPARTDGLRIFPGSEAPGEPVAAPWVAEASLANEQGVVRPEVLWAALDCIGYFASAAPDYAVALLGRMTASIPGKVQAGEHAVVMGWALGREGRKLHAATAVFGADGGCRGYARQIWILLAQPTQS